MRWTAREVTAGVPSIGEIVWAGAEAEQSESKAAARPTSARALLASRDIRFMVVLLMAENSRGRGPDVRSLFENYCSDTRPFGPTLNHLHDQGAETTWRG